MGAAADAALARITPDSLRTAARRHGRRAGDEKHASDAKRAA